MLYESSGKLNEEMCHSLANVIVDMAAGEVGKVACNQRGTLHNNPVACIRGLSDSRTHWLYDTDTRLRSEMPLDAQLVHVSAHAPVGHPQPPRRLCLAHAPVGKAWQKLAKPFHEVFLGIEPRSPSLGPDAILPPEAGLCGV